MARGSSWLALQTKLMNATEKECEELLAQEMRLTPVRVQYRLRIYGRMNKLRTERERDEIINGTFQIK